MPTRTRRPSEPGPPKVPLRRMVVVGGSAGALASLGTILSRLDRGFPAPILVALHLDPNRHSEAAAILARQTTLDVMEARGDETPRPGCVYLAPPDRHLELRAGKIRLGRGPRIHFSRPSIDRLLASAARDQGDACIAVILSGGGDDGRAGVQAVKTAGGTCLAEDPATAAQPGLPETVIGLVDDVAPAEALAKRLVVLTRRSGPQVSAKEWNAAAGMLKRVLGVDFGGYRPDTLRRRLAARVNATHSGSVSEYLAHAAATPSELERLASQALVKVTSFGRDPAQWKALGRHVAATVRSAKRRELRMWSAGCATGEEAYTLAMLALTAAGPEPIRLKVFGTDVDTEALAKARAAKYSREATRQLAAVGLPGLRAGKGGWTVPADARRHVVFGRHDLLRDPPLRHMDVVCCRNVLIYLEPPARRAVLESLSHALRPGGLLFLGTAEGGQVPAPGFVRVAPGMPIFRWTGGGPVNRDKKREPSQAREVLALADEEGMVLHWSDAAKARFGLSRSAVLGRRLDSLRSPRLPVTLARKLLAAARAGQRGDFGATRTLGPVEVVPIPGQGGCVIVAPPAPPVPPPVAKARPPRPGLAANAVMQALNEELQSRNEELETVNEELQSLNDEIQVQGDAARRATMFLTALLDAGPDIMLASDAGGRVTFWSQPAVEAFRLSSAQALGQGLLEAVPALDQPGMRRALATTPKSRRAQTRSIRLRGFQATLVPVLDSDGSRHGWLVRLRPA